VYELKLSQEKRRFLNLDVYIDSKESQIKFAKWYEQFKKEGKFIAKFPMY